MKTPEIALGCLLILATARAGRSPVETVAALTEWDFGYAARPRRPRKGRIRKDHGGICQAGRV
jgi:hypothetical protein